MIACVGELMWDLLGEEGVALEAGPRLQPVVGGAAGNVALELRALGAAVAVGGVVSADAWGEALIGALETRGVDTSAVVRRPGRTGTVIIERTQSEHERYVSFRPDWGRSFPKLSLPPEVRILHLAAVDPDPSQIAVWSSLAREVNQRGGVVSVDLNARPRAWRGRARPAGLKKLLGRAHLCKASERDLEMLGQSSLRRDLPDTFRALGLSSGATLIVTRGGGTAHAVGPFGVVARRPPEVTLRRSVGAGDAFCARLLHGLLHQLGTEVPSQRASVRRWLEAAHAHAAGRMSQRAEEARA